VNYIRELVKLTPLEMFERTVSAVGLPFSIAEQLFTSYADFLKILSVDDARAALEKLRATDSRTDETFAEIREISQRFESALDSIFFENSRLAPLTRKYGVF
jgi:hypothetical protein